ncbi:MAG: ATP-binding protein, partial [Bacteroidota bacterium]
KFSNGGTISKTIEELIHSGFVQSYYSFGKNKRGLRYRLIDEYTVFYLKFIEQKRLEEAGMWMKFSQSQIYKIWLGYAFESVCLRHIVQIKKALGIQSVYSETSVYRSNKTEEVDGAQIDIVIDRNDQIINLLELKFYNTELIINAAFAKSLRQRMAIFQHNTNTKKQLSWVLLSTFGHLENEHSLSILDKSLTIDVLFEPVD